jgi:hypothetical protein
MHGNHGSGRGLIVGMFVGSCALVFAAMHAVILRREFLERQDRSRASRAALSGAQGPDVASVEFAEWCPTNAPSCLALRAGETQSM